MADKNSQTTFSADLVSISIAGNIIGRAQDASSTVEFGTTNVYQIGSIAPVESDYLKYQGTVTLEDMRLRSSDLIELGIAAIGADEILTKGVIDVIITDKGTGNVVAAYRSCTANSYRLTIRANELVTEEIEFTFLNANAGS